MDVKTKLGLLSDIIMSLEDALKASQEIIDGNHIIDLKDFAMLLITRQQTVSLYDKMVRDFEREQRRIVIKKKVVIENNTTLPTGDDTYDEVLSGLSTSSNNIIVK